MIVTRCSSIRTHAAKAAMKATVASGVSSTATALTTVPPLLEASEALCLPAIAHPAIQPVADRGVYANWREVVIELADALRGRS